MKVCLIRVYNDLLFDPKLQAPLGIGYLAAVLERAGHEVMLADLATTPRERWLMEVPDAQICGYSVTTPEFPTARDLMKMLREERGPALHVIGGAHASVRTYECVVEGFDVAVIGEGEITMREIADGKPFCDVHGIAFNDRGTVRFTRHRRLIQNIDSIPFPARPLMPADTVVSDKLVSDGAPATVITASRGCLMNCSFCATRGVWGRTYRLRSAQNIIAELEECIERYGIKEVRFVDDQVGVELEHLRVLCDATRRLGLRWRTHLRVNHASPEKLRLMAESGCVEVAWGCESFAQEILDHNNKGITVEQSEQAVRWAKEAGLINKLYLIIGLPGETRETIEKTKEALLRIRPERTNLSTFVAYPGSDVFENPENYDYRLEDPDWSNYWLLGGSEKRVPFVGRTSALSREELLELRDELEAWLWQNGFTRWKEKYGVCRT